MPKTNEKLETLTFHKTALKNLRDAYLALSAGGVQSYTIGSRSLSKLDIGKITEEIKYHEKRISEINAEIGGRKRRRVVRVIPRD